MLGITECLKSSKMCLSTSLHGLVYVSIVWKFPLTYPLAELETRVRWPVDRTVLTLWENIPPDVYIHLKSEDTKSIILPPFCATSVLERVKSYLFVENISLDYIRKENESITFVQPNLEGYQDWRRIIEFGSYLHTLFCTGSTSLTKINE